MPINQITTPLDSAVLENKEQYAVYFKIVQHAFKELVAAIAQNDICNPLEISFIEQYGELLTYSLEAFRIKYLFDEEEKMKIDLTESGFPSYMEFRYLINDLALKNEHMSKLPALDTLKNEFLDSLLRHKETISDRKLTQASSVIYYNTVDEKYIYKRFVQGKIIKIENDTRAPYLVSWSFYDVTSNRPFLCFMYFNIRKGTLEDHRETLYEALRNVADRNMPADMMAYAIDKKLEDIFPYRLRILDVGPLHNVFAKDELEITHTILQSIVSKSLGLGSYAMSLRIDECISTGTISEGTIFNKQQLQLWEAKKTQRYLLCPHRVMQVLYDTVPEKINALTKQPIEIPALEL